MTTNKKIYSQDQLKVYDAGGDTSKRWFVYFYKASHGCTSGNYLFGKRDMPGPNHLGCNTMENRHRKILRSLKYPKGYVLYSWKHTAAVMAVKAGIHIKQLQIQLRNHSLDQVDQYLRDLGVSDLSDLAGNFLGI